MRNKTDKYIFKVNANGGISMYHPSGYMVPDEEPILIFRAKDLGVLAAISSYMDMLCEQETSKTIKDHIISMICVTESIMKYQSDRSIKSVTCSVEAHKSTLSMLRSDVMNAIQNARDTLADRYGMSNEEIDEAVKL